MRRKKRNIQHQHTIWLVAAALWRRARRCNLLNSLQTYIFDLYRKKKRVSERGEQPCGERIKRLMAFMYVGTLPCWLGTVDDDMDAISCGRDVML